ncbi:uncharacterized protein PV06_09162 [Exophiala oligosperma]|uniref:SCP domain-containing protein n=2 Tax=Chaetothyriales TaxID=34395 RepID=A0A0D2D8C7_9EURO|nr:uncharacterized protein PV06_09162 [Exophiala oligosperma]KAJ9643651.1 hypothetical protein H2204_001796 [Knufia peltigerae]KIW39388.1 hypothetical protein PV06_09162 [Exophiala oligosperma]
MKLSIVALAATCAALTAAKPLDKRALTTTVEWETVTVTVTGTPPAETEPAIASSVAPAPAATTDAVSWSSNNDWTSGSGWGGWGNGWRGGWGGGSASAGSSAAVTYTQPPSSGPAPTSTGGETPSSSTPSQPASTSVSSDYQQGILDSHNIHRRNASVSDLTWSDNMASIAAQIAASCVYAHDTSTGGGGYGQNIGAGAAPSDVPGMITNEMYNNEINWYPLPYGVEPDMTNFEKWGHYSQIVWKSTTSVGCATQYCPNGLANTGGGVSPYFTVCNYSPPGNFGGEYAANVLQPQGEPTVTL